MRSATMPKTMAHPSPWISSHHFKTPMAKSLPRYLLPLVSDPVNHPTHYTAGSIECIDAIQSALTPEQFAGYCRGNAIKYAWRADRKGNTQDLQKAIWYLNREIDAHTT